MKAKEFTLPPPVLVTRRTQLDSLLKRVLDQPAVAVDTESDSLYVYYEKVCLVQLSIPGTDYLIDPLGGLDITPLGRLFANPQVEKVFHAAEYDVLCLKRDYGFEFKCLFDTMWAARVLGQTQVGLAAILETRFGVKLDKRWQRYNWGKRPLVEQALAYARLDTHYLLDARDAQLAELRAAGREEEAREIFEQVSQVAPEARAFDPEGFWRIKGSTDLSGRALAVLRELYIYRDQQARQRNRPVFHIMNDQTLVELAHARPHNLDDLRALNGLTALQIKRYGRGLLEAISRGQQAAIPRQVHAPRPDNRILDRYELLRTWRNDVARQRGVEPEVIMSNATLMDIAQRRPGTPRELEGIEGLGDWRRKTYGAHLLQVIGRRKA